MSAISGGIGRDQRARPSMRSRAVIAFQRMRTNYFAATGYSSRYQRSSM
jgi:hypothetical protein